jgi:hypothetical protein
MHVFLQHTKVKRMTDDSEFNYHDDNPERINPIIPDEILSTFEEVSRPSPSYQSSSTQLHNIPAPAKRSKPLENLDILTKTQTVIINQNEDDEYEKHSNHHQQQQKKSTWTRYIGFLLAILSSLMFSINALIFKILDYNPPLVPATYMFFGTAIFTLPIYFYHRFRSNKVVASSESKIMSWKMVIILLVK